MNLPTLLAAENGTEATISAAAALAKVREAGFVRDLKPANLANAKKNILDGKTHTVQLFRDGDVKDGWHNLNAVVQLHRAGEISSLDIKAKLVD